MSLIPQTDMSIIRMLQDKSIKNLCDCRVYLYPQFLPSWKVNTAKKKQKNKNKKDLPFM